MSKDRFSQHDEDACRLPEGMRRIAYDADTQRYTFRDRSGQLYQNAPGEEYGILKPVAAPLPLRRNVTITERHDPALRQWSRSRKPAKTFDDILPPHYITAAAAEPSVQSPTRAAVTSPMGFVQAAMPKVQGVANIVRRHTTALRRPAAGHGGVVRSDSLASEKRRLLGDDAWEVVRKEDVPNTRVARSKSEMRPSRYYARK